MGKGKNQKGWIWEQPGQPEGTRKGPSVLPRTSVSTEGVGAGLHSRPHARVCCIRVFTCMSLGNMCSALLLAGPGGM